MTSSQRQRIIQVLLLVGVLVLVNLLARDWFFRVDLTDDQRYTLSDVSLETADSLELMMTINVFLYGPDLPPKVKRYSEAIRTTLLEFKAYAGNRLQFQFIDPSDNRALQQQIAQEGIQPVELVFRKDGNLTKKYIFPAAMINYNGRESWVNLLRSDCRFSRGRVLCDYAKAESEIEYKLVAAMHKLFLGRRRVIGILQGQQEYGEPEMQFFLHELRKFYDVVFVDARRGKGIPSTKRMLPDSVQQKIEGEGIDVLIIPQPDTAVSERVKYEIDQFLMRGGRILWLVDYQKIDEQDFHTPTTTALSQPRKLNLDDMFFKYGFRVNNDLVQDDVSGLMDITTTHENKPVIHPMKWVYFPLVHHFPEHPVTRNLNAVLFRYASSLDTLRTEDIRQEVILTSSEYSRAQEGQLIVNLGKLIAQPPPRQIYEGQGNRILGLSLEGVFRSVFAHRQAPTDSLAPEPPTAHFFPNSVVPGKMVVFGDGALVLGHHSRFGGKGMPLDNELLLMNAIDYLLDSQALTEIRDKNVDIRVLDHKKVRGNETLIRLLNLAVPVVLVLLFGLIRYTWRRRRNLALKSYRDSSTPIAVGIADEE